MTEHPNRSATEAATPAIRLQNGFLYPVRFADFRHIMLSIIMSSLTESMISELYETLPSRYFSSASSRTERPHSRYIRQSRSVSSKVNMSSCSFIWSTLYNFHVSFFSPGSCSFSPPRVSCRVPRRQPRILLHRGSPYGKCAIAFLSDRR